MDLTFAQKFLQQRANEMGFHGTVRIRESAFVGPIQFVAEYPDGSFVDLGTSVQDAETNIKRMTGQADTRTIKRQPEPEIKPVKAKAKR